MWSHLDHVSEEERKGYFFWDYPESLVKLGAGSKNLRGSPKCLFKYDLLRV